MSARIFFRVMLVGLVLAVGACESSTAPATEEPMTLTRLSESALPENAAEFARPQRLVIRTQAEWESVWAALWRQNPGRPLPAVDFTRQMVLLAAAGDRPTGGFSIHIDAVSAARDGVRAVVRTVSPGPNCVVIQMITRPIDLAIVRRHDGRVAFEERSETRACR